MITGIPADQLLRRQDSNLDHRNQNRALPVVDGPGLSLTCPAVKPMGADDRSDAGVVAVAPCCQTLLGGRREIMLITLAIEHLFD